MKVILLFTILLLTIINGKQYEIDIILTQEFKVPCYNGRLVGELTVNGSNFEFEIYDVYETKHYEKNNGTNLIFDYGGLGILLMRFKNMNDSNHTIPRIMGFYECVYPITTKKLEKYYEIVCEKSVDDKIFIYKDKVNRIETGFINLVISSVILVFILICVILKSMYEKI